MRSFRLDSKSVRELTEGWPALAISVGIGILMAYFASAYESGRVLIPVGLSILLGPHLIGKQLRQRYPTVRYLWLLSIGMMTCLVGVTLRMAFPTWQTPSFDLSWLGGAFAAILAFVLLNRGNKEIV